MKNNKNRIKLFITLIITMLLIFTAFSSFNVISENSKNNLSIDTSLSSREHNKGYPNNDMKTTLNSKMLIVEFIEPPKNRIIQSENGFNTGFPSVDEILNESVDILDGKPVFSIPEHPRADPSELLCFYKFTFLEKQDSTTLVKLRANPYVVYAEFSRAYTAQNIPNDPFYHSSGSWGQDYDDLWSLHRIGMNKAWDISTGSHDVIVAVIDGGVDYTHPDLAENMWINDDEIPDNDIDDDFDGFDDNIYGADFAYNDGDPMDQFGHGTHCAGIIGAVGNNNLGIVGVNWHIKIMAVQGLNIDGGSNSEKLANAIQWAVDNGAQVLSNSWAPDIPNPNPDTSLEAAINYAYDAGCVIVFCAGNDNNDVSNYFPQNMENVITVAAVGYNDTRADFSNWGELIDVCAPGGESGGYCGNYWENMDINILSLRADGTDMYETCGFMWADVCVVDEYYYRAKGTSMACPYVSGLAALLLSLHPDLTNAQVAEQIISSADNIDDLNPGYEGLLGSGRINASRTMQLFYHNVGLEFEDIQCPIKSGTTFVNASLYNNGIYDETNCLVRFLVNEVEIDNITIPLFEKNTTQNISFQWMPSNGIYEVSIQIIVPETTEDFYLDNEGGQTVMVGVYNSDTGLCFETIQDAIDDDNTLNNHTIAVPSGVYYEHIVVNKSINLLGVNKATTILDGSGIEDVVHVISDGVTMKGFAIQNSGLNHAGIHVDSSNNVIENNKLTTNPTGIELSGNNNSVYHNDFITNTNNAIDDGESNIWYDCYPDGGNYWDDFVVGEYDDYFGLNQNILGSDGILDNGVIGGGSLRPYNQNGIYDMYPLANPWNEMLIIPGILTYVDNDAPNDPGPDDPAESDPLEDGSLEHPFDTIEEGIATADVDSYVYVICGTYFEHVDIDKQIKLIGMDRENTIIDGENSGNVITISSDNVIINDFTIQHSGSSMYDAGISIDSYHNNTVVGNEIIDNSRYGITLLCSNHNDIMMNNITDNVQAGLFLISSNENSIFNNNIAENINNGVTLAPPCVGNSFYHNNFINNNVNDYSGGNYWDNGYPSGGNYWSDFTGGGYGVHDDYSGVAQLDGPGMPDGIFDKGVDNNGGLNQYISGHIHDSYPLLCPDGWNNPPIEPDHPAGHTDFYAGIEQSYIITTVDLENHLLYYQWDWGDGSTITWMGPYESGEIVIKTHTWNTPGIYDIKVKVKDDPNGDGNLIEGLESGWSSPLAVNVRIPGDIDGDGNVGVTDFLVLIANWGPNPVDSFADIDGDGNVGVTDFLILLENWTT